MRRGVSPLRRRLFNLIAGVSAVLCAATAALWMYSYSGRWTMVQGPTAAYVLGISDGYLSFQQAPLSPDPALPASYRWRWLAGTEKECGLYAAANANQSMWACLGLIRSELRIPYDSGDGLRGTQVAFCRSLILPLWILFCCALLAPGQSLLRMRRAFVRKQRRCRGCCPDCGYDLRATPRHCPECGGMPEAQPKAAA
jgi:hypothetical protein